jgi:muramoyltetrapeptide carboxypeptidase
MSNRRGGALLDYLERIRSMRAWLPCVFLTIALATLASSGPLIGQPVLGDVDWVKPRALRAGDVIQFVAPAGPVDRESVEKAVVVLEKMGFRVKLPQSLFRKDDYLAGSDDERATELNAALHDPSVRAIFPVRGGYGLSRILDRIDYAALRKDPKILIGYSDLTALHLAIARKARVITFHSPMPQSSLYRSDGDHAYAASQFWRTVLADRYRGEPGFTIDLPDGQPKPERLVGGKVTGRLIGGNLTLLCATLGTPFGLEARGKILFLEDTGEAPYRVDRLFAQLRLAGVLDEAAGIIVGSFDKTDARAVERIVRNYLGGLKKPVIVHFPVGHTAWNATLPEGALAELDADAPLVRLLENPVVVK